MPKVNFRSEKNGTDLGSILMPRRVPKRSQTGDQNVSNWKTKSRRKTDGSLGPSLGRFGDVFVSIRSHHSSTFIGLYKISNTLVFLEKVTCEDAFLINIGSSSEPQ